MAVRQEPSSPDPHEHVIDVQVQRVFVRRSPRYGRILGAGITVGLVIAAALTTFGAVSGDDTRRGGISRPEEAHPTQSRALRETAHSATADAATDKSVFLQQGVERAEGSALFVVSVR